MKIQIAEDHSIRISTSEDPIPRGEDFEIDLAALGIPNEILFSLSMLCRGPRFSFYFPNILEVVYKAGFKAGEARAREDDSVNNNYEVY